MPLPGGHPTCLHLGAGGDDIAQIDGEEATAAQRKTSMIAVNTAMSHAAVVFGTNKLSSTRPSCTQIVVYVARAKQLPRVTGS